MVKHIILWKLRSDLSEAQKKEAALAIKQGLEGLKGQVPGLVDIHVQATGQLASSNADIMLDSTLESEEALKGYAVHPAHVAVANGIVRPIPKYELVWTTSYEKDHRLLPAHYNELRCFCPPATSGSSC